MSPLRCRMCRVTYFDSHVTPCHMSILRNAHPAVLNLGVKGHIFPILGGAKSGGARMSEEKMKIMKGGASY